ncbi:MAG: hypothetical protein MSC31_08095 [Solirubrobacteraceae bacterium MAG38_C4-C5]|nr:hypothetical protein [Candidatus Siliceabacter maunaloa]
MRRAGAAGGGAPARRGCATAGVALALALAGCAGDEGEPGGEGTGPLDAGPPIRLAVVFEAGRGAPAVESTLTCDGGEAVASGAIADRGEDAACARVRASAELLLTAPDPDRACTSIYGGPQAARVSGTIGDERVERAFSRENGCAISDWDAAVPLLPATEGAAPTP